MLCLLITIIPLVIVISSTSGQVGIDWNRINWVLIDEDKNESSKEDWRDVLAAYAAYDANYLYLKLKTVEPPKFPTSKNDRDEDKYRWFLDFDGNMYWQGNVLYEAEYLISVQDKNDDGIGEWTIFQKWSRDISETSRTATFTMLNSMAIDVIFFKVNPVAMSIPYSILAGLIMMIICVIAARKSKPKEKKSNRRAATAGVVVMALAIIVAAIVSSMIAIGYGINPIELVDFTNWAVIFLVIEAIVFFFTSTLVVRKAQRTEKSGEQRVS